MRFAIEYHRSLRSKGQVKSVLEDIPGIGPARRKALMRHFKSIEDIKKASVEQLMEVSGMPEQTAKQVHAFFRKSENDTSHRQGDLLQSKQTGFSQR